MERNNGDKLKLQQQLHTIAYAREAWPSHLNFTAACASNPKFH
jgi:hypothetical protein